MVVKCGEAQRPMLMEYLAKEGVYHAFLMADIENYGFDKEFQTVYGDWNGENLCGVYLRFYENLILSADKRGVNREFLRQLFQQWQPEVVMGKLETAEQVSALLSSYQKNRGKTSFRLASVYWDPAASYLPSSSPSEYCQR